MKIGVSSYSFQTLLKRGMTYFEACQHAPIWAMTALSLSIWI